MHNQLILDKAYREESLSLQEAVYAYNHVPLPELMILAHTLRMRKHPHEEVTWMVDRNINITNVCFSQCLFCNFCVKANDPKAYVTSWDDYRVKIEELFYLGGRQLLLQGGMHPALSLTFYEDLFARLKREYPALLLHALGPPEVLYLARQGNFSVKEVLERLVHAGLDSLPGAGAEILVPRVRNLISPAKASADDWLSVMREAHQLGLRTSATMMMGHLETPEERLEHLFLLQTLQAEKPAHAPGFVSFIPWTFQDKSTRLKQKFKGHYHFVAEEYVRLLAMSRIILRDIPHIQPSWLTVGTDLAQLCLWSGADDLGSIMMEENVVSAAGVDFQMNLEGIQDVIRRAGYTPRRRTALFTFA